MKQATSVRGQSHLGVRVTACVSALPGLSIPDDLLHALEARSQPWSRATFESADADNLVAFPLVWVDQAWDDGVEHLRRLASRSARERAVLVGRNPPHDIGPRLRAIGALTYAREELPAWLLELIATSLVRLTSGQTKQWWDELGIERDPTPARALETLHSVAILTRELLGADGVEILVRSSKTAEVSILESRQNTGVLVPWRVRRAEDPTAFFEAAVQFEGQVVVPCIEHAVRFAVQAAAQRGAALATLIHTSDEWRVAMLLRWDAAFLPHAAEIGTLKVLTSVAAAAWTQVRFSVQPGVLKPLGSFVRHATTATGRMGPVRALVDACARIAHASAALILLRDTEEVPERLHFACEWRDETAPLPDGVFRDLQLPCPRDTEAWTAAITAAVAPRSSPLEIAHVIMLPRDRSGVPNGAVVLLSKSPARASLPELASGLRAGAAEDLLAYGWPLVERMGETYAQTVADGLSTRDRGGSFGPEVVRGLLTRAAKIVQEALEADQVFVQFGAEVVAFPAHDTAVGVQAGPDSLTSEARRRNQTVRILDIGDTERPMQARINDDSYRRLLQQLGWDAARSVIIAPIDQDRGMLKVYTNGSGRFLTQADVGIVRAVGERVRNVAGPLIERTALHELNMLASKLAGMSGDELANHLVLELEDWVTCYVKPGCKVFILAEKEAGVPIVAAGSRDLKHLREHFADAQTRADPRAHFGGVHVLREPFTLPKGYGLTGSVFLCHKVAITQAAAPLLREAAREIALLLHAESVRQTLLQLGGILRHGLLGPVQGLVSNALSIGAQLEESGQLTKDIAESIRLIRHEAAAVRSWRTENRLVASLQNNKRFEIRTKRSQLRVFVETCVDRFRDLAEERNLTLHLALPSGGVFAEYDPEALDIALSNLMDNAIKYAFYNREVSVGMQLQQRRHMIDIWVEDIGHGIPEQRKDAIYESGTRGGQLDPFRVIRGEGLGLYLARQIALAHDGTLVHSCELAGKQSGDTTPFRVRFTLSLPGN